MSRTETFWTQYSPYLAFGVALSAMLGSLYYSEIAGFVPCTFKGWLLLNRGTEAKSC